MSELNYEQLCAQQALRIANLELTNQQMRESMRAIRMQIYGIGGPLNDNRHGYTKEQMGPFAHISSHAEGWDNEGEPA